tara:strand:- start:284 stop:463 length:180 start_codon:yes stop_codon:yes gene_type:complete
MEIYNISIVKDKLTGWNHYSCCWGLLKAKHSTDGIIKKHMNEKEFERMVLRAYNDSLIK